ncbi:unnamed protein product [Cochlearia groenlandica]
MADSVLEKATSVLGEAKETVTTKTDTVKDPVDNVVTRGIDGAKSMLHNLEERKDEVSSKILGAVTHFTGSTDAAATDSQPLLSAGDDGSSCRGVVEVLKTLSSSDSSSMIFRFDSEDFPTTSR